jgi:hypothetical protein
MPAPLALVIIALASLQQAPQTGVVRGQVRSTATGLPLHYATVQIVTTTATQSATTTDSAGVYLLRNVAPGWQKMRVTHIDHAPLQTEVLITAGKEVVLDLDVELRPVRLPTVTANATIAGGVRDTVAAGQAALVPASVRALESTPGVAELGLAEIAREIPGQEPVDPSDVLYVRGGTADLKLVLLDGAPVYAPFHLGGLINPLDPDMLRSATLYLGGAPARFDGGLSYVMDLETRAGRYNSDHASISADMMGGRVMLEGPVLEHVSYLMVGRTVHGLGTTYFTGGTFPYLYGDGLGRIDIDLGKAGRVTTTGFWNHESVRLDSLSGQNSRASWGNAAGSLRYQGIIGGSNADLTFGMGTFQTQLPVGGLRPLMTDGLARRVRVGINLDRPVGSARLHYGLQFDRLQYEYSAWPRPRTARNDTLVLKADGAGQVAGTYVDAKWQPFSRIQVRAGVRADVFSVDPAPRIAPRGALTVLLTDRASLTLAAGQYRQYVRASGESLTQVGTLVPDSLRQPPLTIAGASHVVLSLDQELVEGIRLGIEGFYKNFHGLPSTDGERAQASGLDLWVRRPAGLITGWLGYSLAWMWTTDIMNLDRQKFAGRHLISAGVGGPLGNQGKFDLRFAYGAGLPYTAIPEPETPPVFNTGVRPISSRLTADEPVPTAPSPPDEPYLRLDLQVARTFESVVRGFSFSWTPYVKVLNALDRRDALFYHFDRNAERPETQPLAPLPILPIFGVEWRF